MLEMQFGWEGAFGMRVEYVVFGEGPHQGVDRLLYGALAYTEDFVGSTHIPFAEALEEVSPDVRSLRGPRPRGAPDQDAPHQGPWRPRHLPAREARERRSWGRFSAPPSPHGRSSVIEGETAVCSPVREGRRDLPRRGPRAPARHRQCP